MKKIILITCTFCFFTLFAHAQESLHVRTKNSAKPDIYIDGKKYDYAIFELLDQTKIKSVNVIKNEQALKEYNAPNGVILIETKKTENQPSSGGKVEIRSSNSNLDPVVIIDGKVSNKDALARISPDEIESIEVLNGEPAIKQHNAPNGAIIVKTKK